MADQPANEWAWVNAEPEEKRRLLWKIRRICIDAGIPRGQQVAYAELRAESKFGAGTKLQALDASSLWLLIGASE